MCLYLHVSECVNACIQAILELSPGGAAVKPVSLRPESPSIPRPFPLTVSISWEDDFALFLLFVYFYLGKASPTGYSSLSFSTTIHYLSFLATSCDCRGLAASSRHCLGCEGWAQHKLTWKRPRNKSTDPPTAQAASFGQCILVHQSHGLPSTPFFPYQLLLPLSTQHSPGRKAGLPKED